MQEREGEREKREVMQQCISNPGFSKYSSVFPRPLVSEALASLNWITTHTFHLLSGYCLMKFRQSYISVYSLHC